MLINYITLEQWNNNIDKKLELGYYENIEGIMNNIKNDISSNRVIGNIVPIVPGGRILGSNQLSANHLGRNNDCSTLVKYFYYEKTEKLGLPPTGKLGVIRRWLGIYSKEEREVLDYTRKLKKTTMQIARGRLTLLSRPDWMRYEDWREVRKLQTKLERRK